MNGRGLQGILEAWCFNCQLVDVAQAVGSTLRFDLGYKQGHVSLLRLLLKTASLQLRKRTGHFKIQLCRS
jgi:hypothetical protein